MGPSSNAAAKALRASFGPCRRGHPSILNTAGLTGSLAYGLGDRLLGERLTRLEGEGVLWLVVIDVETQDVAVFNGVGDGVFV